jgi:hypothetical protein
MLQAAGNEGKEVTAMAEKESCKKTGIWVRRSCDLDGKSYSHGSKVLKETLAVKCVNGRWEGRNDPFAAAGLRNT